MLENILPTYMYELLQKYVNNLKLYEIRLRLDKPIILNISNSICSINSRGLCKIEHGYTCTKELIEKTIALACDNSVYAVENQIKKGFITASNGIRVGLGGEFVESNGSISTIKSINSINIRIPHNIIGCAGKVMPYIVDDNLKIHNTLILSPPGAGKTTLLRDIVYEFSRLPGYLNCLVIDERFEIVAKKNNKNYFNLGANVDVLYGGNKSYSIVCGVRSLAPNIIFTDEIATFEDSKSIMYAKNCGVNVIATMHASNIKDYLNKIELNEIQKGKVFSRYIVLSNRKGVGTIEGVYNCDFNLLFGE